MKTHDLNQFPLACACFGCGGTVCTDAGELEAALGCAAAAGDCVERYSVAGFVGKAALWAGASIISYTNPGITL